MMRRYVVCYLILFRLNDWDISVRSGYVIGDMLYFKEVVNVDRVVVLWLTLCFVSCLLLHLVKFFVFFVCL